MMKEESLNICINFSLKLRICVCELLLCVLSVELSHRYAQAWFTYYRQYVASSLDSGDVCGGVLGAVI
jgi:hypothetical protein